MTRLLPWALLLLFWAPTPGEALSTWKEANPNIRFLIPEGTVEARGRHLDVLLECPGASHYKVSTTTTFDGAEWSPVRTTLRWRLPKQGFLTLYVVFKRRLPSRNVDEVSRVASDTVSVERVFEKVERTPRGMVHWSKAQVVGEATQLPSSGSGRPHAFEGLQAQAEQEAFRNLFSVFKSLPVNAAFDVSEQLQSEKIPLKRLLELVRDRSTFLQIDYPKATGGVSVALQMSVYHGSGSGSLHPVTEALKSAGGRLAPPHEGEANNYATEVRALVLDARGEALFAPTLFPEVAGEGGKRILSSSDYGDASQPYVRYYRTLSGAMSELSAMLEEEGEGATGSTILAIEVLGLGAENPNQLLVGSTYEALLLGNKKSLLNLLNGGFAVVVD